MILKGDCISVMKAIKPNSVDAIVCDPPYGLEFMGKEWDKFVSTRPPYRDGKNYYKQQTDKRKEGLKSQYDSFNHTYEYNAETLEHRNYFQKWCCQWLTEAYRVLKPGGSMLVMGGTRTSHRLACAIEDSGFIIKDTLMWLYGSGFPKAQDLGKMIDKRGGKDISWFIDYVLKIAKERNIPKKELTNIFLSKNGKPTGWLYNKSSHTQGLTIEQYNKIKDFLQLPFGNLEEAKREIVGEDKTFGNSWFSEKHEFDLTSPSTDLAKHWDGFKVGGIKPAYEPIIWAVKPPEGSYVDNVLKWNVGAVNVDETRIGTNENLQGSSTGRADIRGGNYCNYKGNKGEELGYYEQNSKGRFPANVILSHHPECVQVGMKNVKGSHVKEGDVVKTGTKNLWLGKNKQNTPCAHTDKDGFETVESWDCHPDCAVRLLDEQSGMSKSADRIRHNRKDNYKFFSEGEKKPAVDSYGFNDNGGASRFFYCAKASRGERNAGLEGMEEKELGHNRFDKCAKCGGYVFQNPDRNSACKCEQPQREHNKVKGNNHPTVKPIKLFEYLIKLVTREGQIVLDPFIGSGTTAIAAHNTDRKCVGIEKEDEYLTIAKRRIDYWESQPKQMEIRI